MKAIVLTAYLLLNMTGASTPKEVYVTEKGTKYHTHKDCRYIKEKKYKTISLDEAKKQGKATICKACQVKDVLTK